MVDPAQTSIEGWYIGTPDWNGFFLSLDGEIYPASRWEVGAVFLDETRPRPIAWDTEESVEATQEVLRMITYWLLPFARE